MNEKEHERCTREYFKRITEAGRDRAERCYKMPAQGGTPLIDGPKAILTLFKGVQ